MTWGLIRNMIKGNFLTNIQIFVSGDFWNLSNLSFSLRDHKITCLKKCSHLIPDFLYLQVRDAKSTLTSERSVRDDWS